MSPRRGRDHDNDDLGVYERIADAVLDLARHDDQLWFSAQDIADLLDANLSTVSGMLGKWVTSRRPFSQPIVDATENRRLIRRKQGLHYLYNLPLMQTPEADHSKLAKEALVVNDSVAAVTAPEPVKPAAAAAAPVVTVAKVMAPVQQQMLESTGPLLPAMRIIHRQGDVLLIEVDGQLYRATQFSL